MEFSWEMLPRPTLKALAEALDLDSKRAVAGLKQRFGAPPTEDFVSQAWPVLREEWLSRDQVSAKEIAWRLANRKVGNTRLRQRNHDQRLEYLKTCRQSAALREETLAVLIARCAVETEPVLRESQVPDQPSGKKADEPVADNESETTPDGRPIIRLKPRQADPPATDASRGKEPAQRVEKSAPARRVGPPIEPIAPVSPPPAVSTPPVIPPPAAPAPPASSPAATVPVPAAEHPPMAPEPPIELPPLDLRSLVGSAADEPEAAGSRPKSTANADHSLSFPDRGAPRSPMDLDPGLHPLVAAAISRLGPSELTWCAPRGGGVEWWASAAGPTAIMAGGARESGRFVVHDITIASMAAAGPRRSGSDSYSLLSDLNAQNWLSAVGQARGGVEFRCRLATYQEAEIWQKRLIAVALVAAAAGAHLFHTESSSQPVAGPFGKRSPHSSFLHRGQFEAPAGDEHRHRLPTVDSLESTIAALIGVKIDDRASSESSVVARHPGPNGSFERAGWGRRGRSDDQTLCVGRRQSPQWGTGIKIELTVPTGLDLVKSQNLAYQANHHEWNEVTDGVIWGGWHGIDEAIVLTEFLPQVAFSGDAASNADLVRQFILFAINRGNVIATDLKLG